MRVLELIERKRDGLELSEEEIRFIVDGIVSEEVEDYQTTAWMMAICCRGMTSSETVSLTKAMMYSGDVIDLSDLPGIKVDKHSTGGVGDTTTLVVAPLVAACGGVVAKMSGRGLAHSGGTLDKLESIPGLSVEQDIERFKNIVLSNGVAIIGQSGNLDPADKKMYSLRDVSGTVKSIPLIASSIMSKKLVSGADALALDVKVGAGAFMRTLDEARELAREMVEIGKSVGRRTVAVITDMNRPLGMAIGNGLEMKEAIDVLCGRVSLEDPLVRVCLVLGSYMLILSRIAQCREEAEALLKRALVSGEGYRKLRNMIELMGGAAKYVDDPELLIRVKRKVYLYPEIDGYIGRMDAQKIGIAACMLGAGREKKTDVIDPAVGILMHKRYGDIVCQEEPYATLYVNDESRLSEAVELIEEAVEICAEKPSELPLIYDVVE